MTIPSTERKAGPLLGTGAQTTWPFTFKVFAEGDIKVTIMDDVGVETVLVLNTDYSVALNSNQETSPGGTVTYPISGTPLATGSTLTIVGDLDYDQPLDLPSGGNFSPTALENQLDRTVMQLQQLKEQVGRSVKAPVSDASVDMTMPAAAERANRYLSFDLTGRPVATTFDIDAIQNASTAAIAAAAAAAGSESAAALSESIASQAASTVASTVASVTPTVVRFSGDGVETDFTLPATPGAEENTLVFISGVYQQKDQYSVTGTTLAFTSAPPLGTDNIEVQIGPAIQLSVASALTTSFQPAGTGAVATTVQAKLRETVSVKDFGAVGDGVTDDSQAVRDAIAALFASDGNTLFFPDGVYYFATPVTITFPAQVYNRGLRLLGTSMAGFVSARPGGARITGASGIEALFIFTKTTPTSAGGYSFECENIDFDGNAKGVGSAIVNKIGGAPMRPFNVYSCNFRAFEKAIYSDISATGLTTGICQVNIEGCNFQGNDYALYGKGQSAIMDLRFVGNVCEQNTLGGIYTEAVANGSLGGSFLISDNLLEGQPDAITINGGLCNGEISRNYFEANTDHLIYLTATGSRSTVTIKNNFLTSVTGTKVYLSLGGGTCDIQDNFQNAGVLLGGRSISAKSKVENAGTWYPMNDFGGFHLDYHVVSAFTDVYPGTLTGGTYVNFGGANATTPVGSISVTAVSGNSTIQGIGQTFATGDWIVAMGLMRAKSSDATVYLAALTSVNAGAGNSSSIRVARNGALGEWVFVCHFVQVSDNSGGDGRMRWVTSGDVDIAQSYVYKIASPTLSSTPIYYCLPE